MLATRLIHLTRSFSSLSRHPSILNKHTILCTLNADGITRLYSIDVKDESSPVKTDDKEDLKLQLIKLEMEMLRQDGRNVPDLSFIKKEHWSEMLELNSKSARQSYYNYLYVTQMNVEREKAKKQQRALVHAAFKEQQTNEGKAPPTPGFLLPINEQTINKWRNNRLFRAMQISEKLVFDCSYDEYMNRQEANAAAGQLMEVFDVNRQNRDPFDLHFCNVNFNSATFERLQSLNPTLRDRAFPLNLHETSYLDVFPKDKLVYLTPHCRTDLTDYDPDAVYIIGAMVDIRNHEPLSMMKAKTFEIKMARLPLDRYLDWGHGDKTLTLDLMLKIMLEWRATQSWEKALKHVPIQKHKNRGFYVRKWTVDSCSVGPINVRYASNLFKEGTVEHSIIRQTLDQNSKLTTNEWHELREKVLQCVPKRSTINVDQIIIEHCRPNQLHVGKSYVDYLKRSGQELKLGTLVNLLKLYCRANKHGAEITAQDKQQIIDMYRHFLEKYPVFDAVLGSAVVQGLVLTADWRKALDVLDSIKIYSKPSMDAYSAVVQRAIHEEDEHVVWNLLNVMATECRVLDNEVFTTYIGYCEKNESSFTEKINKLLTFIGDNQILVSTKVAKELHRVFHRFNHSCHFTTVSKLGKCQACRKSLRGADYVTDDEFNRFRIDFLDKALIGHNIFTNSTPQELEAFNTFIDKTMPYDCVIDGLNTAFLLNSSSPMVLAKMLAKVVKHFVHRKKTVLVVGRKHMERWPKAQMNYIRSNANLFLTEDLSTDDPFFLYAALKSGPNTDFVTRDLMRDHALKLDDKLKTVFRRWQQKHQYMVKSISDGGLVRFENRFDFDMNAQQVDEGGWHIPFEDSSHCTFHQTYLELRKNWLCVSKN